MKKYLDIIFALPISSIRDIVRAGAEAALVKDLKRRKYLCLDRAYVFEPIPCCPLVSF